MVRTKQAPKAKPGGWTGGCPWCYGPEKNGHCVGRCAREGGRGAAPVPASRLADTADTVPHGFLAVSTTAQVLKCRSCGTPMGYAGKVPLDLSKTVRVGGVVYAPSHFATCPKGNEWRRGIA